jgi:hypothetical protein
MSELVTGVLTRKRAKRKLKVRHVDPRVPRILRRGVSVRGIHERKERQRPPTCTQVF